MASATRSHLRLSLTSSCKLVNSALRESTSVLSSCKNCYNFKEKQENCGNWTAQAGNTQRFIITVISLDLILMRCQVSLLIRISNLCGSKFVLE